MTLSARGLLASIVLISLGASAERLYVSGFELQTTRAGVETDPGLGAGADAGTFFDATSPHGGLVAGGATAISGRRSSFSHFFVSATAAMYARVYVRLEQPVNATTMFLLVRRSSAVPAIAWLTVDPAGVVRPQVWVSAYPATAQLTVGQWHRFDIFVDERGPAGTHQVQIALDGQTFVLASGLSLSHIVDTLEVGLNVNQETASSGVMLFDDLAVNGTVGADQNGFPTPGRLFLMRPDGPGPAPMWTPTDGGLAELDNWRSVSELPPDDAVTALQSTTNASAADEYEVEAPPAEAATSTISLVTVGARFTGNGTTNRSVAVSLRSSAAGTLLRSAALPANVMTWFTNRSDGYLNVPLSASLTPEGAAWTAASLDTMRIGLFDADSVARPVMVTSVWALVELDAPLEPPPPQIGVIGDGGMVAGSTDAGSPDAGVSDAGALADAGVDDGGLGDGGGLSDDGGVSDGGGLPDDGGVSDGGGLTDDGGVRDGGGVPDDGGVRDGGGLSDDGGVRDGGELADGGGLTDDGGVSDGGELVTEPGDGGAGGPRHYPVGCACSAGPEGSWLIALAWGLWRSRRRR